MSELCLESRDALEEWARPFGGYWLNGECFAFAESRGVTFVLACGPDAQPKRSYPRFYSRRTEP